MHFLYKKKILLNGHICTFHNLNCMYDYYLVADRYKNDIFSLNLLPTPDTGRGGLVMDFSFIFYKK